ncbi:hypothetical protein [Nocardioides sp. NPDC127503]|uniref:hypothetical protein n=1 Tax=Nocardioides sp. NPDC127503 TaxID=3154516 RepID=UPI0033200AE1
MANLESWGLRARGRISQLGFPIFCIFLGLVGASEALRLVLQGETGEARYGGWYLMVVSALVASGALVRTPDATQDAGDSEIPQAPEDSGSAGAIPVGEDDSDVMTQSHVREAVIFFAAVFVYAWALPWIGFALANALFITAFLILIDHRRWFVAITLAVIVDVVIVVGMDALNVLLPTGVIGLPF